MRQRTLMGVLRPLPDASRTSLGLFRASCRICGRCGLRPGLCSRPLRERRFRAGRRAGGADVPGMVHQAHACAPLVLGPDRSGGHMCDERGVGCALEAEVGLSLRSSLKAQGEERVGVLAEGEWRPPCFGHGLTPCGCVSPKYERSALSMRSAFSVIVPPGHDPLATTTVPS